MQTKIALINPGRVGSTLLQFGLDGHSKIRMKGEVLANHAGVIDDECKAIIKRLYGIDLQGVIDFDTRYKISRPEYITEIFKIADGVKLQTTQLLCDNVLYYHILSHINQLKSVKIIYLDRHPVHRHISLQIAMRDKIWHTFKNKELIPREKITISLEKLNGYIDFHKKTDAVIRHILQNRPSITVWYEDLIADWDGTTGMVLDFLGYEREALPQAFIKTIPDDFSQTVENYEEIKDLINECRTSF